MSVHEEVDTRTASRSPDAQPAAQAPDAQPASRAPKDRAEPAGPRIGRPRSETAERAIIEATLDLIAADGLSAVSIEGVAAKAGVGKTTIYRRWPNKEALICDAAASLKAPLPELPCTSVREDLLLLARIMQTSPGNDRTARLLSCLHSEAYRYPELAARYKQTVIEPRREAVRAVFRRGVQSGELRDDLDIDTMRVLFSAPLLYRALARSDDFPAGDLAETVVDTLLAGLRPRSAKSASAAV
jgi:AcrR family transcriptional regulator